jgi:glycosyltransferase involved in cell wall biosynthesis
MNIGMIHPELIHPRGAEKQVCKLCYFLDKMGHDITFYTFEKENNYVFDYLLTNVEIVSLDKPWILTTHWSVDDVRWAFIVRKLSQMVGEHDIINAHNHPAQWISNFTNIPVVWTCNEPYMHTDYKKINGFKSLHYRTDQYFASNVRLIVTFGEMMRGKIKRMYPNKPVKTVGSGVDLERKIKHVDNDYFDSIFVGPIHPKKHPLDVLKAFSLISNQLPNPRLHFVGDVISKKLKKEMDMFAASNKIDVEFYGSISDAKLYELYDIADIAVFVPESEPWGMFPLETMLGRIPTIISDHCGITDVLPEYPYVVSLGDTEQMAIKILEIRDNPSETAKETRKISKYIADNFSWESYSTKMLNSFKDIL